MNGGLSNITLDISGSLRDVCDDWIQQIGVVGLDVDTIVTTFQPLIDQGVATQYVPSLQNALNQISSLVQSVSGMIKSTVTEQEEIDDTSIVQLGTVTLGTNNQIHYTPASNQQYTASHTTTNTGTNTGINTSTSTNTSANTNTNTNTNAGAHTNTNTNTGTGSNNSNQFATDVNNNGANLTIQQQVSNALVQLDSTSYASLLSVLLAGVSTTVSLNGFLSNPENAENIKQQILQQQGVPDNIKELVANMDSSILLTTLEEWVEHPVISDVTQQVCYTYLESLAQVNQLSLENLLKDREGVVMALENFREVSDSLSLITDHQVEDSLLDIYNGKSSQFDDKNTYFLKSILDSIAQEKNVKVEELLTNEEYKDFLNSSLSKIERDFQTLNSLGYQNFSNVSRIMSGLFVPSNAGTESK